MNELCNARAIFTAVSMGLCSCVSLLRERKGERKEWEWDGERKEEAEEKKNGRAG